MKVGSEEWKRFEAIRQRVYNRVKKFLYNASEKQILKLEEILDGFEKPIEALMKMIFKRRKGNEESEK